MFRKAFMAFLEDRCMLLSAALAFYTALSFAPALILTIWASSFLGSDVHKQILSQISHIAGEGGSEVARMVLANAAARPEIGTIAGASAVLGLLVASTTLFAQVHQAMNLVWNVEPRQGSSIVKRVIQKRLLGFLMMLFVLALLIAAVIASAMASSLAGESAAPEGDGRFWQVINTLISIAVFTPAVAAIFKFFPDVIIRWRTVWIGSLITGCMLVVGKYLTGLYLSRAALGSSYGAGGTLFVLLLWAYYSWAIVLLGAEFIQLWARAHGHRVRPDAYAVTVEPPADSVKTEQSNPA